MINRYPLWKNLLVLIIVTMGVIYALPNIYPPDFAVQISNRDSDGVVTQAALDAATQRLDERGIAYFRAELESETTASIRFPDGDSQIQARDQIELALYDLPEKYIVALNQADTTPDWLVGLGGAPMTYGLDLRGGVHFLLEVDTEDLIAQRTEGLEDEVKRLFRTQDERIRYSNFTSPEPGTIEVVFRNDDLIDRGRSVIRTLYPNYTYEVLQDRLALRVSIDDATIAEIEDFAVGQNLGSLRNRVNELGVAEPLVQRLGRNRIVLDLPGVQDPTKVKDIIGKIATLEFRMEAQPDAPRSQTISEIYQGFDASLERDVIVRGDRVLDAQVGYDPDSGLPQVNITLDGTGGELMHKATRYDIGRRMAVVYIETRNEDVKVVKNGVETFEKEEVTERRVISLATVQAALGVRFRITGLEAGEARDLALLLRAGALAANMYIVEERTVGASLGAENIQQGAISVVVGLSLVVLFMLVYYKLFGLAANIALAANLTLLVAIMSALGATLTLPGIAGIVLTVGMAVDANVLIFSRIKEELKNKLPPQQAINAGFERAFVTILDANLTTLIVAVILYSIGTGPVKGFAVTLSIGILTSMFTAIMGTRAIVNLMYGGRTVKSLAI